MRSPGIFRRGHYVPQSSKQTSAQIGKKNLDLTVLRGQSGGSGPLFLRAIAQHEPGGDRLPFGANSPKAAIGGAVQVLLALFLGGV